MPEAIHPGVLVTMQAEPVAISQASEVLPEYWRVWCQGELQHERSLFVGPRPRTIMGSAKPGCFADPCEAHNVNARNAPQALGMGAASRY